MKTEEEDGLDICVQELVDAFMICFRKDSDGEEANE